MKKIMYGTKRILVLLFILSFLIRIIFLNDGLFHHDSVVMAQHVENFVDDGNLRSAVSGGYVSVLINSILYFIFRNSEFAVNFSSVLFGSLAIVVLYLFVSRLYDKKTALFSALLFSFCPVFLSVTTFWKNHGLGLFLGLLAGYFLLRDKRLFGFFLFALSIDVRFTNIFFIFPFCYLYFAKLKRKISDVSYFVFLIIVFIIEWNGIIVQIFGNRLAFDIGLYFKIMFSALRGYAASLSILVFLVFLLSLIFLIYKKENLRLYILWIVPFFLYISSVRTFSPRFLLFIIVPSVMVISVFLNKNKKIMYSLLIVLLVSMLVAAVPMLHYRHNYSGPKEYALFVKSVTADDSLIIANDEGIFLDYYAGKEYIGYPIYSDAATVYDFLKQIYDEVGARDVYIQERLFHVDENVLRTMAYNFEMENVGAANTEVYHHAELELKVRNESLFRLSKKEGIMKENMGYWVR